MAEEYTAAVVVCRACGEQLQRTEQVGGAGPNLEFYQCDCGRRAVLIFEPGGGLSDEQRTWVEREVQRRGSFFPSDHAGPSRFGR